jgi:hypothetical protein
MNAETYGVKYLTLFFLLCLMTTAAMAQSAIPQSFPTDITTVDGQAYHDVKILEVTDDGITIMHQKGGCHILFSNLSLQIQKLAGHDPAKIAAEAKAEQEKEQAPTPPPSNVPTGVPIAPPSPSDIPKGITIEGRSNEEKVGDEFRVNALEQATNGGKKLGLEISVGAGPGGPGTCVLSKQEAIDSIEGLKYLMSASSKVTKLDKFNEFYTTPSGLVFNVSNQDGDVTVFILINGVSGRGAILKMEDLPTIISVFQTELQKLDDAQH